MSFMSMIVALLRDRKAATAIEYALIASLISILIVVGASSVGTTLIGIFQAVAAGFK